MKKTDRLDTLAEKAGVFRYMYNEFDVNADSVSIREFGELIVKDVLSILDSVDAGGSIFPFDPGLTEIEIAKRQIKFEYGITPVIGKISNE